MNKIGIFAGQFGYDSFDDLCSWGRGEFFRELKGLCESSNIGVYFGNEAESEILDCLICGAIPIYSGDKSIYKFIPRGCVIECRDFSDASKVIEYCNSLTNEELITIQKNIIKFVSNFNWYEISEKKFAKEIFYKIQKAIKK